MKLNIDTIKENRDFSNLDELQSQLLIETLYDYSVIAFDAYNRFYKLTDNNNLNRKAA